MGPVHRLIPALLLTAIPGILTGQSVRMKHTGQNGEITELQLRAEITAVPGQGREIPGVDLFDTGLPRHMWGDDPAYAARTFNDTLWSRLRGSLDTVVAESSVHWVRVRLLPEGDLCRMPLLLHVRSARAFEVHLNGHPLLCSPALAGYARDQGSPGTDSVMTASVPVQLLCDGAPEVIAVRVEGLHGEPLQAAGLGLSLHMPDVYYAMQRRTTHFGVFIGINLIILLLALVIWTLERRDDSWLLLALLSFVTALGIFSDMGQRIGALGFSPGVQGVLRSVEALLTPWPMYLLVMVLVRLRGDVSPRRIKRYTQAVLFVTAITCAFGVGILTGVLDTTQGFEIVDGSMALVIVVVVLVVLLALVIGWFAVEVVRLGIRVLRSGGYARWIGGGALASSLLALVLNAAGAFSGSGLGAWLGVIADYCSYVAVPASVAVYLAIRSAHHNKLVARQRDELDAEVKERTAQLSAEKERSDELLLNILPAEVAEELKRTGAAEARHFDRATVLFTDFQGFTALTEQVGPAEVLQELNSCFKAFDDIIGRRGIEKIKTIGDAYMCASGLPDPKSSTPADVVFAALEMQEFMERRRAVREQQGMLAFAMRAGIHTGPVVAGIVGVKKFQYDIWGDTVNTASRMESSGEVGQVNLSEAPHALVKDASTPLGTPAFVFTPRGKVQAKGKGEIEMWYVERA